MKSLFEKLQNCKTEEDIKDAYIKALNIKKVSKNLIDIVGHFGDIEIWFEAKIKGDNIRDFSQLLHYVYRARNEGKKLPTFLCVIDKEKAAIVSTEECFPILDDKSIVWGRASSPSINTIDKVEQYIGVHIVRFNIKTQESEFLEFVKDSLSTGKLIRNEITPDNLTQVYHKWVDDIGKHIEDVDKQEYPLLFFADIMSEGKIPKYKDLPAKLCYEGDTPFFVLQKQRLDLNDTKGYHKFWSIYNKPPKEEHRNYLLSRRDSLIYTEERMMKGAYYTPLKVVDKAYDKLTEVLGAGWQKEYIVWDMCCGVGNLEMKHSNHRNIFMSTLDKADIDIIKSNHTCPEAKVFQYDYLNDDVTDDGKIDYSKTKKIPIQLQDAIKSNKKILVLINPPYAEAGILGKNSKQNVSKTKVAKYLMDGYGKSSNELFTQFLVRISKEIPNCTIGVFSKLKYVNAPNFELFRNKWRADYLGGFVVRSKAFDDLKGEFPIGFLIWKSNIKSNLISDVRVDVFDKDCKYRGEKYFYNIPSENFLSNWVDRLRTDGTNAIPLKNCISPSSSSAKPNWHKDAIGYLVADANDVQQSGQGTLLLSSANGVGHKGGFFVTKTNLFQVATVFTARRIIKPTWLNDRDQFLQPNKNLSKEFQNDCLVWMLFNGSNLTASADNLKWNGKNWSIVNHFIPFKPSEVGSNTGWESYFMVDFMENLKFSKEATQVLAEGKKLWKEYFSETDEKKLRESLKLNRCDVGWYQIRKALENRGVSFDDFQAAYQKLTNKLQEQVYEYGFLMP